MTDILFLIRLALAVVAFGALIIVVVQRLRGRTGSPKASGPVPLTVGLKSTHDRIASRFNDLMGRGTLDERFFADLEATLVEADVGIDVTATLLASVRKEPDASAVKHALAQRLTALFSSHRPVEGHPRVILVLGVNGVGKTTTIAKLARAFQNEGKRVLLVAGDTFRAAAVEQLQVWGERLKVEVVAQAHGADPAAVAFDGVEKAKAKGYDVVLIDTAGRLHTKVNLMEELKKVGRVIAKALPGAPHERWLVLDATVGSNGLNQARQFHEAIDLTGAIVTKLDGTAKGGIVCAVAGQLGIPITHIGVGEGMDDLRPFDPQAFVDAILQS